MTSYGELPISGQETSQHRVLTPPDILSSAAEDLYSRTRDYYETQGAMPENLTVLAIAAEFSKLLSVSLDDDDVQPFVYNFIDVGPLIELLESSKSIVTRRDLFEEALQSIAIEVSNLIQATTDLLVTNGKPRARSSLPHLAELGSVVSSAIIRSSSTEARSSAAEAREAADEAEQAAGDATETAGEASEHSLAEFYARRAGDEGRLADRYRAGTVVVLVAAIIAGGYFDSKSDYFTASEALTRFSILIPIAALVAYLAKVSHDHRQKADRAAEISVQMQTIVAFTARLGQEDRRQLQIQLGGAIFTGASEPVAPRRRAAKGETEPSMSDDVLTAAVAAAIAAVRNTVK